MAAVLVDTQIPGGRCRILLHDYIASIRLLWWRDPPVTGPGVTSYGERGRASGSRVSADEFPALQVTPDGVNLSMFD
ncbi:hypothetical protein GCM10009540_40000 [Streptomyces turgidiscabies]